MDAAILGIGSGIIRMRAIINNKKIRLAAVFLASVLIWGFAVFGMPPYGTADTEQPLVLRLGVLPDQNPDVLRQLSHEQDKEHGARDTRQAQEDVDHRRSTGGITARTTAKATTPSCKTTEPMI